MTIATSKSSILVLISHSSRDEELALSLIELLRAALGLLPHQIRCSSVDGYRLPVGVNTEAQLRGEVNAAKIVIGLMTPHSLASPYVLFELGARWGRGLRTVPLLAGIGPDELRGPLSGMNAMSSESEPQLHQLVEDIAKLLALPLESPAAYSRYIPQVIAKSRLALGNEPQSTTQQLLHTKEEPRARIHFSRVPVPGAGPKSRGRFIGTVIGLSHPEKYKIVLYALTDKWYVQPLASASFTKLDGGGNWESWTHLGFRYGALVVSKTFKPAVTLDSLPDVGGGVIAKSEVAAYEGPNPLP
jgi:hypothetical protein